MRALLISGIISLLYLTNCQKNFQFEKDRSHLKYHSVNFTTTKIDTISWGYLIEGFTENFDSVLIVSSIYNEKKNCKKIIQIGKTNPMKLRFESYYGEIDGFQFEGHEYSTNFVIVNDNKNLRGLCLMK